MDEINEMRMGGIDQKIEGKVEKAGDYITNELFRLPDAELALPLILPPFSLPGVAGSSTTCCLIETIHSCCNSSAAVGRFI